MEVYAVTNEPLTIPQRKDLKGKTEAKKIPRWAMLVALLIIVATVIAALQFGKNLNPAGRTWEGSWEVQIQVDKNEFQDGELTLNRSESGWNGKAIVEYGPETFLELELLNIVEDQEENKLTGNWKDNLTGPKALSGQFEFKMENSYKSFEGEYTTETGNNSFTWTGRRK